MDDIYQKIFDLKSWLGLWTHSHDFSLCLGFSRCVDMAVIWCTLTLDVWIKSITWEGNTPRILKCFRCLGCRTMPHHYPRPTLSTCGPVILEGLCGARDDRCSICFIFFPYLLDSFSIFVSCFFILFWYAFHMFYISFIYIYISIFFHWRALYSWSSPPKKYPCVLRAVYCLIEVTWSLCHNLCM